MDKSSLSPLTIEAFDGIVLLFKDPKGQKEDTMKKWTLLKNKVTGERSARNNETGQVITEKAEPEAYAKIRKNAIASANRKAKDDLMSSFGLVKCKGAVTGQTYYE